MNATTGYKPNPDHVKVLDAEAVPAETLSMPWCIELSTDATIVELALLMTAFCCRAELVSGDLLRLVPQRSIQPRPTGEQVRDVFERGFEQEQWHTVRIRCRPEVAPVIEVTA